VARFISSRETTKDSFTSDSNAELKFATGPITHKALFGVDYRGLKERASSGSRLRSDAVRPLRSRLYGVPANAVAEPDLRQSQLGLYAQDQMRLGPWLAVLGVRQDFVTNNVQGSPAEDTKATTGRAGLMYELPFGLTPYVTYAQSFTPIFGSGVCATASARRSAARWSNSDSSTIRLPGTAINGAIYDTTEKNRLASDPDGSAALDPDRQGADSGRRARGDHPRDAGPRSDRRLRLRQCRVESGDNAGKHVETVPEHQASLWAKYRLTVLGLPGVTVGGGVRYIGESWDGTDTSARPTTRCSTR
jgi:iron complex outermembrane receptor protein